MNSLSSSFPDKTSINFKTSAKFNSYLIALPNNKYNTQKQASATTNAPPNQVASLLVHELRNPLTNINLSIEMLEFSIKDKELKEYLEIIKRSSKSINILIGEFLKCQEVDEIKEENHSLHQLLNEVLETANDRFMLKRISIRKVYDKQDDTILMNRPKIKMALTNIIINAIDAMTTGQGELILVTKSIGDGYFLEIEDNGCGISKENLKYIFKPYFTNKPGGLGLGLAATDVILRSNHVEVNVESVEGEGTKFILLFRNNLHSFTSNGKNRADVMLVTKEGPLLLKN
jgi:signal transduction histidine kinase